MDRFDMIIQALEKRKDSRGFAGILEDFRKYPDKVPGESYDFEHDGLFCHVNRNFTGTWCGYVDTRSAPEMLKNLSPHGGVTFTKGDRIGFDCNHFGDFCPLDLLIYPLASPPGEYRDYNFAVNETKKLAEEVQARKKK